MRRLSLKHIGLIVCFASATVLIINLLHYGRVSTFNLLTKNNQNLVEDLLSVDPPVFLTDCKNPCWRADDTKQIQCLPYFQLIGMDKSGSTDLFRRLTKHPDIIGNTAVLSKEASWWSWHRYGLDFDTAVPVKDFQSYLKYFNNTSSKIANADNRVRSTLITGDGTPMDMWDFRGWIQIPQNKGLKEPRILTPHLIHHINPKVKLIIIMRNPVDRLYSDYFFILRHKPHKTPKTFHEAVKRSIDILRKCLAGTTMKSCLYNRTMHSMWNKQTRLNLGFYSIYMTEWLAVFPREQFFIIRTEDYSKDLYGNMQNIFEFLGVRNMSRNEMKSFGITSANRFRVTKGKHGARPMLNEMRQLLTQLYKPFNHHLAEILKDQAFTWSNI